jgi:hypothetical protein
MEPIVPRQLRMIRCREDAISLRGDDRAVGKLCQNLDPWLTPGIVKGTRIAMQANAG